MSISPTWSNTRDEILENIPLGTFVVTRRNTVGLLYDFTPMLAQVIFVNNGRRIGYTQLRPATDLEVKQAGLHGVGGLTYEELAAQNPDLRKT
jgi:hypothetical protein